MIKSSINKNYNKVSNIEIKSEFLENTISKEKDELEFESDEILKPGYNLYIEIDPFEKFFIEITENVKYSDFNNKLEDYIVGKYGKELSKIDLFGEYRRGLDKKDKGIDFFFYYGNGYRYKGTEDLKSFL